MGIAPFGRIWTWMRIGMGGLGLGLEYGLGGAIWVMGGLYLWLDYGLVLGWMGE